MTSQNKVISVGEKEIYIYLKEAFESQYTIFSVSYDDFTDRTNLVKFIPSHFENRVTICPSWVHAEVPTPIHVNGDRVTWSVNDDATYINKPCFADSMFPGCSNFSNISSWKLIPRIDIGFFGIVPENGSLGKILPNNILNYLVEQFKLDGLLPQDIVVDEDGTFSFGNAFFYKTYVYLCIYRLLINEGVFSYILYSLHKNIFPELPITQILFYLKNVFNIEKTGHWFINAGEHVTSLDDFIGLCRLLQMPEERLRTMAPNKYTDGTITFLKKLNAIDGLSFIRINNSNEWLSPIITELFKDASPTNVSVLKKSLYTIGVQTKPSLTVDPFLFEVVRANA